MPTACPPRPRLDEVLSIGYELKLQEQEQTASKRKVSRGSSSKGPQTLSQLPECLYLCSHNTAVLGNASLLARRPSTSEIQARTRRLNKWIALVEVSDQTVFVELDRAALPKMMPKDCDTLVHLSDPVLGREETLALLKKLSSKCTIWCARSRMPLVPLY